MVTNTATARASAPFHTSVFKRDLICVRAFRSLQRSAFRSVGLRRSCSGSCPAIPVNQTCARRASTYGQSGLTKNTRESSDDPLEILAQCTAIYGDRLEAIIQIGTAWT